MGALSALWLVEISMLRKVFSVNYLSKNKRNKRQLKNYHYFLWRKDETTNWYYLSTKHCLKIHTAQIAFFFTSRNIFFKENSVQPDNISSVEGINKVEHDNINVFLLYFIHVEKPAPYSLDISDFGVVLEGSEGVVCNGASFRCQDSLNEWKSDFF